MEGASRTWRAPSRAVAIAVALFVTGFVFSNAVRSTFLLFFVSFLLAVVLDYPVRLLARFVRRPIAAALVFLLMVGSLAAAVRFTVPMLVEQGGRVVEQAPASLEKAQGWWNRIRTKAPVDGVPSGQQMQEKVQSGMRAEELLKRAPPVAAMVLAAVSTLILVLVLATFMVASPEAYADGIVRMVPAQHERVTREFLRRLVVTIRGWMVAQLISMTFVGVLTAIALAALGVKSWMVLALVNFFCEFVPYLGPFVGAVPGVAVAFATSTRIGIYALIAYIGIQQLEGLVISPLAMRREVSLAPPVLLVWQVLMGAAFGIPGIVVATPLLACVKVTLDFFWVERTLGKPAEPVPER